MAVVPVLLIDARGETEFNEGHGLGAVNVSLASIESVDFSLKADYANVYCDGLRQRWRPFRTRG